MFSSFRNALYSVQIKDSQPPVSDAQSIDVVMQEYTGENSDEEFVRKAKVSAAMRVYVEMKGFERFVDVTTLLKSDSLTFFSNCASISQSYAACEAMATASTERYSSPSANDASPMRSWRRSNTMPSL